MEIELDAARKDLGEALADGREEDAARLHSEMDRITCQLRSYEDNWVPEVTDTDYNELG